MANFNFNKVLGGGRLTADPELRTTTSGTPVVSFGIAVNRRTKPDEEHKADFFDCKAWRGTAEFISRYFKKGSSIFIVGHLKNEHYQGKDEKMVTKTIIEVDEALFVDGKNEKPETPNFTDITNAPSFDAVEESLPF